MKARLSLLLLWGLLLAALADSGLVLPSGWEPLAGAQHNMSLYATVLGLDGNPVETAGSVLAVFDANGQCRGTAEISEGPAGLWFQMTVVSNTASEGGLVLRVLDAMEGEVYDIKETFAFAADTTLPAENYTEAPLVLHCRPLTAELELSLVQNWNWISFNVEQGERTLAEFLEDYTPFATNGDIVKGQSGQATYSNGKWYASPASFRLEPGRMYKLRKQSAGPCTVTVTGAPCTGEEPIAVVAGWNWIGYTGQVPATVEAIYKEGGFAKNDLLKPQSGSQATYSNGRWYGSLVLRAGLGYMLKQGTAGVVDFRNAGEHGAE